MIPMIIQIRSWLLQTKVWRFVGFVSAAVGLICYSLSSSFNHLFGNWNLLKVILYTLFSFIICLMILYANIWQNSRSLRFKAHTAFLVLTITSVYSFFFDKVVNGKPDAYSLISCAAFAIMSMSLSRQSRCGIEVDLLYFFLGCLIMQLMKIKLQLVIVGAGFSYSLIIIRSSFSSINTVAENEYFGICGENSVVIEMDSQLRPSNDFSVMMQQLTTCTDALKQESLNLIDRVLEEYNQDKSELHILCKFDFVMDSLPSEKIHNLHEIVRFMVAAGYEKECFDVYSSWRRVFLRKCLINKAFGLPYASINTENEVDRVEFLNTMFARWMTALEVAMTILFPIERQLCDIVFLGFSSAASLCFVEVSREPMFQLLNIADAVISGNPSKWRLFKMVDIFEQFSNLIPNFQSLLRGSTLLNEAIAVQNSLGEASRDLFMEMHNFVFRVPTVKQDARSNVHLHPITIKVMSYVSSACMSRRKLEQILQEYPKFDNEVDASSFC